MAKQSDNKLMSYTPVALQMYDVLAEDMEAVRDLFSRELLSDLPLVNERIGQVGKFRGKMLRPALVLLCGRACGPVTRRHHVVATVVELLHMAALIHDDVLDQSKIRRRGETLNDLYGNETAILAGDFLLSHAFSLCSQLDFKELSGTIAGATNMVCEGEIMQVAHVGDWELSEQEYLQIISRKTASLCGASCRLGVDCSSGSAELARALDDYGCHLGMAFQITDDLLDLVGTEGVVGKTLGRDLLQGKPTLPTIRAKQRLTGPSRQELSKLLSKARPETLERIRQMARESGALESVQQTARIYVDKAIEKLAILQDGPERQALARMARFVADRQL